jgi:predicted DNA-binding transcriptional regulator YafY
MPAPAAFDAFTTDEIEALWLGLLLVLRRSGDIDEDDEPDDIAAVGLVKALEDWRRREIVAAPVVRRRANPGQLPAEGLDREALRAAIRNELKLDIAYVDGKGRATERRVWPLSHTAFGPSGAMLAWCETRAAFRNFRFDRIRSCVLGAERMPTPRAVMLALADMDESDAAW